MLFPVLLIALIAVASPVTGAGCRFDKDADYARYPAVMMDLDTWRTVVPSEEGDQRVVSLTEDQAVVLACPGNTIDAIGQEVVAASCAASGKILIEDTEYDMIELGCKKRPKESMVAGHETCSTIGTTYSIGFDIDGYDFYELVSVCFDPKTEENLSSKHVIRGAHIGAKDNNPDRPGFKSGSGIYSVSANEVYLQSSQAELMLMLLSNDTVIDFSESHYFARGHMSPDADFVTEQEQDATYYYINAVPQWQAFNNGNWKVLEGNSRKLAEARGRDLQVWSGSHRVLQLQDINNNDVDIYLGLVEGETVVPAPDITWKVVYDSATNEAAAVVGINNPFLTEHVETYCGSWEFCEQLQWLSVDTEYLAHGGTYCCTVQELAQNVPNAPQHLSEASLLSDY